MRASRLGASVSHTKLRKLPVGDPRGAERNAAVGAAWLRPGPGKAALSLAADVSHWTMGAWLGGTRAALDSGKVRKIASGQVTAALGFTASGAASATSPAPTRCAQPALTRPSTRYNRRSPRRAKRPFVSVASPGRQARAHQRFVRQAH